LIRPPLDPPCQSRTISRSCSTTPGLAAFITTAITQPASRRSGLLLQPFRGKDAPAQAARRSKRYATIHSFEHFGTPADETQWSIDVASNALDARGEFRLHSLQLSGCPVDLPNRATVSKRRRSAAFTFWRATVAAGSALGTSDLIRAMLVNDSCGLIGACRGPAPDAYA
jgi:hypothetical protein